MVQGERELKGQESNMPKPYLEPNPTTDPSVYD